MSLVPSCPYIHNTLILLRQPDILYIGNLAFDLSSHSHIISLVINRLLSPVWGSHLRTPSSPSTWFLYSTILTTFPYLVFFHHTHTSNCHHIIITFGSNFIQITNQVARTNFQSSHLEPSSCDSAARCFQTLRYHPLHRRLRTTSHRQLNFRSNRSLGRTTNKLIGSESVGTSWGRWCQPII